ncbi:MAG TPA: GNAT family N-acetyltransferase [Chthoniobacterales bacterium]|nr:GNAT family N-acetyltransferase [Chthoniobacterales bacterium]
MLRDYRPSDADALNEVALWAFLQFERYYSDWKAMRSVVARMSELSSAAEIIVAEDAGRIVGGVAYVGMDKPKPPFFDPGWPVIRMLVVAPPARSKGLGRRLTEACILRAHRDRAPLIALHTTPVMEVALAMYLRLGFLPLREAPPVYGVPYSVYIKTLGEGVGVADTWCLSTRSEEAE